MNEYRLQIPGEPVPKARPRVTKTGHAYTPAKTRAAEHEIALAWQREYPGIRLTGPLYVEMVFNMKPPQGKHPAHVMKRPDIDNLQKTVLDALNGVAYEDDKQVFKVSAIKRWAGMFNGQPGIILWIREAE